MQYTVRTRVAADAGSVWAVVQELSAWPTWTPTFESIGSPGMRPVLGLEVSVKQPSRRAVVYTVDRCEPGRRFRWSTRRTGVIQWADHVVTPLDEGSCEVELSFSMTGWLGRPMSTLGARTIRQMVDTEARGLRSRAEAVRRRDTTR